MEFKVIEAATAASRNANIKVVGVGGGGNNALEYMMKHRIEGVHFVTVNTDMQVLDQSSCERKIQLGEKLTSGLGAGADPDVGRQAAEESRNELCAMLEGVDMVFITAGMGGGTGTGAAPVIAELAKEQGVLSVAVVTKPFPFEGGKRLNVASRGLAELREHVDSLIVIPNEKLMTVLGKETTLVSAFSKANEVLSCSVQGIAELITREGLINLDFADIKTVMSEMGTAMMGSGTCGGDNRSYEATQAAISNPLLEDVNLTNARGVLINVTASDNFTINELTIVGECIKELAHPEANVVTGMVIDPTMENDVRVTLVATGLEGRAAKKLDGDEVPERPEVSDEDIISGDGEYDSPTVVRRRKESDENRERGSAAPGGEAAEEEKYRGYLDIPSFLRRQAD